MHNLREPLRSSALGDLKAPGPLAVKPLVREGTWGPRCGTHLTISGDLPIRKFLELASLSLFPLARGTFGPRALMREFSTARGDRGVHQYPRSPTK